ncbi:hypothetical protein KSP39_PZI011686 [Platanthera zijinensis]|uniref:Uncharacterized protein n=1 Tax=Platanthera zijinensis TaxID=2320716 RepID=A0AAP0BG55_9ASPA
MGECLERFQHSTETISRYFSQGLDVLIRLSQDVIASVDNRFTDIPAKILNDDRYMSYFKDCI